MHLLTIDEIDISDIHLVGRVWVTLEICCVHGNSTFASGDNSTCKVPRWLFNVLECVFEIWLLFDYKYIVLMKCK